MTPQIIPKFSSFKPSSTETSKTEPCNHESQKRSHKTTQQDRSNNASGHTVHLPLQERARKHEKLDDADFVVDRRGDDGIEFYRENDRSKVPIYRPCSHKRTLGAKRNVGTITLKRSPLNALSREDKVRLKGDGKYHHGFTSTNSSNDIDQNGLHEFISLQANLKRKRPTSTLPILGDKSSKSLVQSPAEDNSDIGSSSSTDDNNDLSLRLRQENARLANQAKSSPNDIKVWHEYIDFQDEFLNQGDSGQQDPRSIAEVKMSMYRKAIKSSTISAKDRETLDLGLMHEAQQCIDETKVTNMWQEIIEKNNQSPRLWLAYLTFMVSRHTNARFETIRDTFADYFKVLRQLAMDNHSGHADLQVFALLKFTTLLHDAGYAELSIALWQISLETQHFSPSFASDNSISKNLEDFWDSEKLRIGETGSSGWQSVLLNGEGRPAEVPKSVDPTDKSFIQREQIQSQRFSLPERSTDETGNDDPYSIIFFSDLEPFLITLPTSYSTNKHIGALLHFIGLPPLPSSNEDGLLIQDHTFDDLVIGVADRIRKRVRCFKSSTLSLFDIRENSFSSFDSKEGSQFVENILSAIVAQYPQNHDITEYYLAFLVQKNPSKARKKAKTLLKTQSSNLRLYNTFAIIESTISGSDAGNRIFTTALGMSATLHDAKAADIALLRCSWVWSAVHNGDDSVALWRAASIGVESGVNPDLAGSTTPTPAMIERAQQTLQKVMDTARTNSDYVCLRLNLECLTLLTYLTSSDPLRSVASTFHELTSFFATIAGEKSLQNELFHQAFAHLVKVHVSRHSLSSPSVIRAALTPSHITFPSNTLISDVFDANESRFQADDRVRSIVRSMNIKSNTDPKTSNPPNTTSKSPQLPSDPQDGRPSYTHLLNHLQSIDVEISRLGSALGSTVHSVRGAFERAIQDPDPETRHSELLWKKYLFFELDLHEKALESQALKSQASKVKSSDSGKAEQGHRGSKTREKNARDDKGHERSRDVNNNKNETPNNKLPNNEFPNKEPPTNESSPLKVKNIFFRALRELPWNKSFAMLAFEHAFDGVITAQERKAVYEGMVERGLRMCFDWDLEDEWNGMGRGGREDEKSAKSAR